MGDGLRTIRVVTSDEVLLASARGAIESLGGWEFSLAPSPDDLLRAPPALGDVILLDGWLRGQNVYEWCRTLAGRTRCRTFVVVEEGNQVAEPIALFCGATGVISRPITASKLRSVLGTVAAAQPRPPLPQQQREETREAVLPERLLLDLAGEVGTPLVSALIDPETRLYNYEFLTYKLDEEFKRAKRFGMPLSCVMLGFEGQASAETLGALSSVFLLASRDTDILGRFDESSFLFLLPNTGPDGAAIMARRIRTQIDEKQLRDLVGDRLEISVGISSVPHPSVKKREDLYSRAREAFFEASSSGGGLVLAR